MNQRIGIFGGTFDPVHLGHLVLAEQCREQARLDQVWFIPAARPPHKQDRAITAFTARWEMLELACAGNSTFQVLDLEKDRPGPSYTVDTLEELSRQHPGAVFSLLLGSDCLPDLATWREPARIAALANLVIVTRPGWALLSSDELRSALRLPEGIVLRHQVVEIPLIDISSRDLRRRVMTGRSLRYLVSRSVECYIETHRLYQKDEG